jgi:hypothetical protein
MMFVIGKDKQKGESVRGNNEILVKTVGKYMRHLIGMY